MVNFLVLLSSFSLKLLFRNFLSISFNSLSLNVSVFVKLCYDLLGYLNGHLLASFSSHSHLQIGSLLIFSSVLTFSVLIHKLQGLIYSSFVGSFINVFMLILVTLKLYRFLMIFLSGNF